MQHEKCWFHVSWAEIKYPRNVPYKNLNILCTNMFIAVSEHCFFAKIIHSPERCGISGSWLNSWIIIQVHRVLRAKGNSKMCNSDRKHNASDVLRECAIDMLTAGMSTRAVNRELKVNFSTICHFREFGSTSNWPNNLRPRVTTPAQDRDIWHLHLRDRLRPCSHPDSWWNWGIFLFVIKPFCGKNLLMIGWAWRASGWAWYQVVGPWLRHLIYLFQLTDFIIRLKSEVDIHLGWSH